MDTKSIRCSGGRVKVGMLRCMAVMVLFLFVSGCGYHFAASAPNRIVSGQSLWVSFIWIEVDSPSAQTVLRRALLEEFHALRGLAPSADAATADIRVSGGLRTYSARAMSYTALDQAREYRLTVEVDLEMYRKGEVVPFWKGTVQGYQDYPANSDLSLQRSAEEAALSTASRILARKVLMAVEQVY